MRKIIRLTLLILWMLVIFSFSQTNGEKSSGSSIGILKSTVIKVSNTLYDLRLIKNPLTDKQATKIANDLNYPARKIMHMSEYFILAILFYGVYILYNLKRIYIVTIISSILYAISDEIHQLFTGRTGTYVDVLFDTAGILIAIYVIYSVNKIKTKKA